MLTYFKELYLKAGGTYIILMILITTGNMSAQSLHTTFADLPCVNKTFHAMVFICAEENGGTGINVENIEAVFAEANRIFAPICISFKVAKIDTIPNYSYNEIIPLQRATEAVNLFSLNNRLNVYFVFDLNTFPTTGYTEGNILSAGPNGLFVRKNYGPSFFHQLGIFFGLVPTHGVGEPSSELVDGSNCAEEGDQICDTPADPFFINPDFSSPRFIDACEFIYSVRDPNEDFYQPDVGNAMSYYGCPCTGFTREQFLKMVENYNNAPINLW